MIKKCMIACVCAMLTLIFAACSSAAQSETSAPQTTTTAPATTTTAATTATTVPETSTKADAVFEELVLVDNDDFTFKITAVENDPIWGYTLKVFLENKTDKELMFSAEDVSVNGFMCDPYWAVTVSAGKKSNSSISWLDSSFEENSITQVEDIAMTLHVYDSNDIWADDVLLETFHIHP